MFWSSLEERLWAPDSPKSQAFVKHVACFCWAYRTPSFGEMFLFDKHIFLDMSGGMPWEEPAYYRYISIIIGFVQISHQEVGGEVWKFMIQRCIMESDLPFNKVEFSILPVQVCVSNFKTSTVFLRPNIIAPKSTSFTASQSKRSICSKPSLA